MDFYYPWAFILFLILPLLIFLHVRKRRTASVRFSSVEKFDECGGSLRLRLRWVLFFARLVCIALLIVALARPRKGTKISEISTEGVAMEIVVDRSGSMGKEMVYEGKRYNRLEVVKKVLDDFVGGGGSFKGRHEDLVGLITFAKYADTLSPLSHGHNVLLEFLKRTEVVTIRSEDGTAIGDAIALAAARLKKAEDELIARRAKLETLDEDGEKSETKGFKIKSKIIILLTDGSNNAGEYDPLEAAELAKEWGIKIYTIGIGAPPRRGGLMGSFFNIGQDFDEGLLKNIAQNTNAFYGRAGSGEQLLKIYREIDKLEKTEVKSIQYTQYAERFGQWAMAALCVLCFEIIAGCTVFRKVP